MARAVPAVSPQPRCGPPSFAPPVRFDVTHSSLDFYARCARMLSAHPFIQVPHLCPDTGNHPLPALLLHVPSTHPSVAPQHSTSCYIMTLHWHSTILDTLEVRAETDGQMMDACQLPLSICSQPQQFVIQGLLLVGVTQFIACLL